MGDAGRVNRAGLALTLTCLLVGSIHRQALPARAAETPLPARVSARTKSSRCVGVTSDAPTRVSQSPTPQGSSPGASLYRSTPRTTYLASTLWERAADRPANAPKRCSLSSALRRRLPPPRRRQRPPPPPPSPPPPPKLEVRIVKLTSARRAGRWRVIARIAVNKPVSARARVGRQRRTWGDRTVKVRAGTRSLTVPLTRRARRGKCWFRLVVRAGGETRTLRPRTVKLGR